MKRRLILLFAGALIFRIVIAPLVWHPDLNNHVDWGIKFFEYGANKFYAPESNVWSYTWPNQPPGTILIFAFIRKLYEIIFNFFWQVNISLPIFPSAIMTWVEDSLYQTLLKLPSIMADLGIAYLIYKLVLEFKDKRAAFFGAALFLFNPVIWYNSAVWGQTDAIINFFALAAFFFLVKKKLVLSMLVIAVCLYVKISLLIFLPIFAIYIFKQKYPKKSILLGILIPAGVLAGVSLLFSDGKEPFSWLVVLYSEKILVNQLQLITANAFNLWAFLEGIHEQPHSLMLGFMTFQAWGMALFGISLAPILYKLWRNPKYENAVWAFSIICFSSWMLLTNMHERYLYPLFPYFTILVAIRPKLLPLYVGVSGINLLNMYNFWWVPEIKIIKDTLSLGNRVSARVLGAANIVLYVIFYGQYLKISKFKK